MGMFEAELSPSASTIAKLLHQELRTRRIESIGIDHIRCAVAGYVIGRFSSAEQREHLVELTTRKVVELVG